MARYENVTCSGAAAPRTDLSRSWRGRAWQDAREVDELSEFARQLDPLGLVVKDIIGDGNCLFRSVPCRSNPARRAPPARR